MNSHLHIVATGARTPVGLNARASAAAVRGRIRRIGKHPVLRSRSGAEAVVACDGVLSATMQGTARVQELAGSALLEALAALGALAGATVPIEIVVGLPEPRPGHSDDSVMEVARTLQRRAAQWGANCRVWPFRLGHAAAFEGLRQIAEQADAGYQALYVLGGVDSYIDPQSVEWLEQNKMLFSPETGCGLTPGEGAGFVIVTSEQVQRSLGLPSLARVRGVHTAEQATADTTELSELGEGLRQAIAGATGSLHLPGETIENVFGDLNGESHRSNEWGYAALWAQPLLRGSACVVPAGEWGDVGAASGALLLVLAVEWFVRRCAHGRRALVWASSHGGLRGAALLEQG